MSTKSYTVTGTSTTLHFARKDRAVKAANQLGESAVVTTPAGKVVHTVTVEPTITEVTTVKVCKKDASHGAHRVTKSGSYCYACDRVVAEAQKAARAAAKVAA
jgi:hypothetical protein